MTTPLPQPASGTQGLAAIDALGPADECRTRNHEVITNTAGATVPELSLGRAVITGGLMVTKAVKESKSEVQVEQEGFVHLYPAAGAPLVFRQTDLNYSGLGTGLQPSMAANLIAALSIFTEHNEPHMLHTLEPEASLSSL